MDTEEQLQALARRLREARAGSQVANKEASDALGVTDATISKWIAKPGKIQVGKLIELARVYGLPEVGEDLAGSERSKFDEALRWGGAQ